MSSGKSNFCTLPLWAINCVRSSCDPCDPWDWNGLAPNPWEIAKNPWENWKIPRSKEEPACPAFSTAFQSRRSFEKKKTLQFSRVASGRRNVFQWPIQGMEPLITT